jgi:hypothetical protein
MIGVMIAVMTGVMIAQRATMTPKHLMTAPNLPKKRRHK